MPLKIVAQQYGPQIRSEVVGDAVQKAFSEVVNEQKLRVAGYPRIEPKQDGVDQNVIAFSATFEVYPEFKPGDVSGAKIERLALQVSAAGKCGDAILGELDSSSSVEFLQFAATEVKAYLSTILFALGSAWAELNLFPFFFPIFFLTIFFARCVLVLVHVLSKLSHIIHIILKL